VNPLGDGTVSFKSELRSTRRSLSQPHLFSLSSAGGGVQQLWSDMLVGASISRGRMIVHPPPGIMAIGRTLDKAICCMRGRNEPAPAQADKKHGGAGPFLLTSARDARA